jgi:hypothetical protein
MSKENIENSLFRSNSLIHPLTILASLPTNPSVTTDNHYQNYNSTNGDYLIFVSPMGNTNHQNAEKNERK